MLQTVFRMVSWHGKTHVYVRKLFHWPAPGLSEQLSSCCLVSWDSPCHLLSPEPDSYSEECNLLCARTARDFKMHNAVEKFQCALTIWTLSWHS